MTAPNPDSNEEFDPTQFFENEEGAAKPAAGEFDPNATEEFINQAPPTTEFEAFDQDAATPGVEMGRSSGRADQVASPGVEQRRSTSRGSATPGPIVERPKSNNLMKIGVGSVAAILVIGAGAVFIPPLLSGNQQASSGTTTQPEMERIAKEAAEKKKLDEQAEKERLAKEATEKKKLDDQAEKERLAKEAADKKKLDEQAEKERLAKEEAEKKKPVEFKDVIANSMKDFQEKTKPEEHADAVDKILEHGKRIPPQQAEAIATQLRQDFKQAGLDPAVKLRLAKLIARVRVDVPQPVNEAANSNDTSNDSNTPGTEQKPDDAATEKKEEENTQPDAAKPDSDDSTRNDSNDSFIGEPLPGVWRLALLAIGGVDVKDAPEKIAKSEDADLWDAQRAIAQDSTDLAEQVYALHDLALMCKTYQEWERLKICYEAAFKILDQIKPDPTEKAQAPLLNVKDQLRDFQQAYAQQELDFKFASESLRVSRQSCRDLFDNLNLVAQLERLDPQNSPVASNAKVAALLKQYDDERKTKLNAVIEISKRLDAESQAANEIVDDRKALLETSQQLQTWQDELDRTELEDRLAKFDVERAAPEEKSKLAKLLDLIKVDPKDLVTRISELKNSLQAAGRSAEQRAKDRNELAALEQKIERLQAAYKVLDLTQGLQARLKALVTPAAPEGADKAIIDRLQAAANKQKELASQIERIEQDLANLQQTAEQAAAVQEQLVSINQSVLQLQVQYEVLALAMKTAAPQPEANELTDAQITELATKIANKTPFQKAYSSIVPVKDPKDPNKELPKMFPQKLVGADEVASIFKEKIGTDLGTTVSNTTLDFLRKNAGNLKDGGSVARLVLLACLVDEMRKDVNGVTGKLQVLASADKTAKSASEQAEWARREAATLKDRLTDIERALAERLKSVEQKSVAINEIQKSSGDILKQMTETDQSIAKQIESLESRVGAVKERIEVVRVEPRPLPDAEREKLAREAADQALKTMLKWGYVPTQWSTPGPLPIPTAQAKADARKHFQAGREAFASITAGSPEKSLRELSQAVILDPTVPLYRFYLGLALYREGKFEDAAEHVRQGATLEGPPKAGSLARELEPIQGSSRRWLDQIRMDVRSRLEQPAARNS